MKQTTQTTEMPELSIDILRQLAFMQYEGNDYFILNGKAYEGNEDEIKANHSEHNEGLQGAEELSFEEYVSENCTEVEDFDNDDYLVLTDEEADEKTKEYIQESVWAFTPSFLADQTNVPMEMFEALQANGKCESNNDAILNCIEDLDDFTQAAISADGRGHFLSSYDGCENEETIKGIINAEDGNDTTTFYIYRTN